MAGFWLPTLLAVPALIAANVVFSAIGDGAATRAATVTAFVWIAFVSVRMLQKGSRAANGRAYAASGSAS